MYQRPGYVSPVQQHFLQIAEFRQQLKSQCHGHIVFTARLTMLTSIPCSNLNYEVIASGLETVVIAYHVCTNQHMIHTLLYFNFRIILAYLFNMVLTGHWYGSPASGMLIIDNVHTVLDKAVKSPSCCFMYTVTILRLCSIVNRLDWTTTISSVTVHQRWRRTNSTGIVDSHSCQTYRARSRFKKWHWRFGRLMWCSSWAVGGRADAKKAQ